MKVQVSDHQHKSVALATALKAEGVELTRQDADILLIDWDGNIGHYPKTVEKAYSEGAEVVLYSHGAPAILAWDGIWNVGDYTRAYVAQSPGQKWVMEAYDYPHPVHVIGWHYCKQKKYQPAKKLTDILFAPWHPFGNGWINPTEEALNKQVYDTLLTLPYRLTVRHVWSLKQSGLDEREGVIYQHSNMTLEQSIQAIDEAQLVVTNPGTFACLAIARGKPVVMYGQDIKPHDGYSYEQVRYVKHWDKYREYMRYTHDISATKPRATQNIIEHAAIHDDKEWRSRFIGDPLDSKALTNALQGVLDDA